MIGAIKGKVISGGKKNFKNESGEDISYWRVLIADKDADYPMSLTVDNDLGEHILANEAQVNEYINKLCILTVNITKYQGQYKIKVTDIQPSKE